MTYTEFCDKDMQTELVKHKVVTLIDFEFQTWLQGRHSMSCGLKDEQNSKLRKVQKGAPGEQGNKG